MVPADNMELAEKAAEILDAIRASARVSVHCITSSVSEDCIAETVQAMGACPSFTHDAREVGDFVGKASAVFVQLGASSELKEAGMMTAIDVAKRSGKPWIFDARLAHRSIYRAELAHSLARQRPRILCGRPDELAAAQRSARPVRPTDIAKTLRVAVVSKDQRDVVANPLRAVAIENHCDAMSAVNGLNSALGAICAVFAAFEDDGLTAAAGAMAFARHAGERAGAKARGPGSFRIRFLDEIATMSGATLAAGARIKAAARSTDDASSSQRAVRRA